MGDTYRLVLIHVPTSEEHEIGDLVDVLERRIRVPQSSHRSKPGIRLPVVLEWRGRILVLIKADWNGEKRLREALAAIDRTRARRRWRWVSLGALTVAVVTKPFTFEGTRRSVITREGIECLGDYVDTLIVVPNDRLLEIVDPSDKTVDSLMKLDLAAGVDVQIKLN
mgnify:CR=1 FL=1